jgi:NIMA-interacting peptidyl-prolyl cis-trans isomerase 1
MAQVQASHILLMYQGSMRSTATRSKAEAEAKIADIFRQIADGAEFDALAKTHSDCPSRAQGGDLGRFGPGQMVPEFERAAFGLAIGAVSGVVETPFGYHLIKRTA